MTGDEKLSDLLKWRFDHRFKTITKNDRKIPFSVDVILKDLLDSGLTPLEAIGVLEEIEPFLEPGIENRRIIKLINQAFQKFEFEHEFTKRNYLQPIIISYPDGSEQVFNYRAIKDFLRDTLSGFEYTSKTFKAISDELHRIVYSLRTDQLKSDVLDSMVPSILRNVIGVNPFSSDRLNDDYQVITKLERSLTHTWEFLPSSERTSLIFSFFESFYRIVLLHYNYLPGYNFKSTITQVNQLIADLTENKQDVLTDKEIYIMGKTSRELYEMVREDSNHPDVEWLDQLNQALAIVERLMDEGTINWLILIDDSGSELYSRFSKERDLRYKSLIGMAISGVQSLVNELTDKKIKQIEQEEGSIMIERDQLFSIVVMVEKVTPAIQSSLQQLKQHIRRELTPKLENFTGNVSEIKTIMDTFIDQNFSNLFL